MSKDFMSGITETYNSVVNSVANTTIGKAVTKAYNENRAYVKTSYKVVDNAKVHTATEPEENIILDFEPNILDNYDTYTYHWKLFITSLDDANSGNVLKLSAQTIIAESGVSDLTIVNVELHSIAVPSVEAGTGTQTVAKFEIVEPSGAGLLDKLYYQAVSLGIGNWIVMPTFLQLEFRGRDPETGESVTTGAPGGMSGLKWVWPIKLTNAKANVTHIGTRYQFDAIMYSELAQSNSYFSITANIVLEKLTTLGDAIKDLENKINADQWEKLIDNYSIPDTYSFVVDPEIASKSLIPAEPGKNSSRSGSFVDFDKKTASFNAGTGIDKVIDALCTNMDYFQTKTQDSASPAGQPRPINQETNSMKTLWRIVTETKPIGYDILRQDNAVEVTVYIVTYKLGMADVDAPQTGGTAETDLAAKKRFLEYAKNKIMKKKYNYIFTGLNDQIDTLDLNMNFSYAASLARFGGIYYDSAISDQGINAQKNAENEKNITDQLRKTLHFINSSQKPEDLAKQIQEFQKALADANIDEALRARYSNILKYAVAPDRQAQVNNIKAAGGVNRFGGTLGQQKIDPKSLAAPISGTNANGDNIQLMFISDVNTANPNTKKAEAASQSLKKGKLRPIPYRESNQEVTTAGGVEGNSNAGRARVASIFSTALHSTLDASLVSLKLTIKGDPFWLFPAPVSTGLEIFPYLTNMGSEAAAINRIKNAQITTPNSVNLYGTDNFIVIRFRTPRIYNLTPEETDPFTEVDMFSGVYKVITITSKFTDRGKFLQELTCILDPVIDLSKFLKDIENDAQKTTNMTTVAPNATTPATAVKTDRMASASLQGLRGANLSSQITGLPASNIPDITNPTATQLANQAIVSKDKV
jgi:hypothetical protein